MQFPTFPISRERIKDLTNDMLRLLTILAVFAASYWFGRRPSIRYIVMLVGTGIAVVFLRFPILGLLSIIAASFLVPFQINTGTQTSINIAFILIALLLGVWAFEMFVRKREIRLVSSLPILPLMLFSAVAVLAFGVGQLRWFALSNPASMAAQLGGLSVFLFSAGAFLWVANQITELRYLKWAVWLFFGLGAFDILAQILPGMGILYNLVPSTLEGSIYWVWLVALVSSQVIFNNELKMRWRIAFTILTLLALFLGFRNISWASGWLPPIVGLLTILFLRNWRLGSVAIALLVLAYLFYNPAVIQSALSFDRTSLFTRQAAWQIVLSEIVRVSPIFGLGPANYYHYTPLFPILGYYVKFNSHNQFVDLIAQVGILGTLLFFWFITTVGVLGLRLRNRVADGFSKAFVYGALGGVVGSLAAGMLGDWIIPFIYNIGIAGFRASVFAWLFMGGLVVLDRLYPARNQSVD